MRAMDVTKEAKELSIGHIIKRINERDLKINITFNR